MLPIRPAGLAMVSGKPVVIMPAHSISVALTFFLIVVPNLNLLSGLSIDDRSHEISTKLKNEINNKRHITGLYLVEIEKRGGKYYSTSLGFGSNLIRSLSTANGFVEVGPEERVKSGEEIIARFLGPNEMSRVHKE